MLDPTGTLIATSANDAKIKISDIAGGDLKLELSGSRTGIHDLLFLEAGKTLLATGETGEVQTWDVNLIPHETQAITTVPIALRAAASPDSQLLAVGNAFGPLSVFDTETTEVVAVVEDSIGQTRVAAFHPTGEFYAAGGFDGIVRFFDAASHQLIRELRAYDATATENTGAFWDGIWQVKFSPDGRLLATGSFEEQAKVWNVESGDLIWQSTEVDTSHWGVVFSPNGEHIAVKGDVHVTVFEIESGEKLWQLDTTGGAGLNYNNSGSLLVTGGDGGSFDVVDAVTGERMYETPTLVGFVQATTFSPDDRFIITSDNDQTAVWDAATGEFLYELADYPLGEVIFTQDGRLFAAGFSPGHIAEYTFYLEDALALAQGRVIREMTEAECLQYLRNANCETGFEDE